MAMLDLSLNQEQTLLRESLQRFLADNDRPSLQDLSDRLGLAGLALPLAVGGFGGGVTDIALVMAELGPALVGADWLSHTVAVMLLARAVPGHPALADLAAGALRIAVICPASAASMPIVDVDGAVRGTASLVAGAADADLLLLADRDALLLIAVDGEKVERRRRAMHDGSVVADLDFKLKRGGAELLATGAGAAALASYANDVMLAGRCAEAVGLMQRMIADSIDYLGQRRQFGRAIGGFQALRHRIADMRLAVMKAAALTEVAISAVDEDRADRGQAVSAACVEVGDAVRIVGEGAVQLHGAMGLTEELSLGGQFKRGLAVTAGFGPRAALLARFAEVAA